jgi:hypothetical protein
MKHLPWWLYDYIIYEELRDFEYNELPFEVDENEEYEEVYDKVIDYIEKTLGYELMEQKLVRCDVEDRYYDTEYVIKLQDKYYRFKVRYDDWSGYDPTEDIDVKEVKPVEKTVTVYEAVVVPV